MPGHPAPFPPASGPRPGGPASSGRANPGGPSLALAGVLSCMVVAAAAFAVFVEWAHYRALLDWTTIDLAPYEQPVLVWVLAGKSLWLLAPVLALAGILSSRGRTRAAVAVAVAAGGVTFSWLAVDLRVAEATRNHLSDYVAFLAERGAWQWGGGAASIVPAALAVLAAGVLVAGAAIWLFQRLALDAARRWPGLAGGTGLAVVAVLYGVMTLGVIPAARALPHREAVAELSAALPASLPLLPGAAAEAAVGDGFVAAVNLEAGLAYRDLFQRISSVRPADDGDPLAGTPRPNVVLIVLESWRADALDPRWMPRLDAWSREGLRLARHYAGANASHLGLFGLVYGRHPLLFDRTLDARVPPQLTHTLRRAGYHSAYWTASHPEWMRMEEFLNARNFDEVHFEPTDDWPAADRAILTEISRSLAAHRDRPQLNVVFLMSTHFPYRYSSAYERHVPTLNVNTNLLANFGAQTPEFHQALWNRYLNALASVDEAVSDFLQGLDLTRNLVIVTGDHGESFYDDGTWMHWGGTLSEVQTRVPMVIRGPGVAAGVISRATLHTDLVPTILHALAGRSVPLQHTHGRDLLDREWPDEALLAKPGRPSDAVLVRGKERLDVRVSLESPSLYTRGMVDANGHLQRGAQPSREEAAPWVTAIRTQIERLAR
jgi:membrane-anchored protein YejM (alkaline phosphatase superfamily)